MSLSFVLFSVVLLLLTLVFLQKWRSYQQNIAAVSSLPTLKQFIPYHNPFLNLLPRWLTRGWGDLRSDVWKQFPGIFIKSNTPIIAIVDFANPVFVVNDPKLIHDIGMVRRQTFSKPTHIYRVLDFYGENIVTADDGPSWKRHRQLCVPAFTDDNLRLVLKVTVENTFKLFEKWKKKEQEDSDGKKVSTIDAADDMTSLTLSVIGEAGFGQEFPLDAEDKQETAAGYHMSFQRALEIVSSNLLWRIILPKFAWNLPIKKFNTIDHAFIDFEAYMKEIIENRRRHVTKSKSNKPDLLTLLVNAVEQKEDDGESTVKKLTERELLANTFMFLVAGHETTAHTLAFTLGLLADHPEVQTKLREEVDKVLGGRTPVYDDYEDLHYCRSVFKEALRLYPAVVTVPKRPNMETTIAGHKVPEGSLIYLAVHSMHHNPKYWPEPEKFKPERFDPRQPGYTDPGAAFSPFSIGPRSCLGTKFALVEGTLFIALFSQHYKLRPTSKEAQLAMKDVHSILTLQPKHPLHLQVERLN